MSPAALLRFVLQLTDYNAEVLVGRHSRDWVLRTLREVGGHDEWLSDDIGRRSCDGPARSRFASSGNRLEHDGAR